MSENLSFKESLEILGIEKYSDDIWNSNSNGELFHTYDYIDFAKAMQPRFKENPNLKELFKKTFNEGIEQANKNWSRPASVFQHIIPEIWGRILRMEKESDES